MVALRRLLALALKPDDRSVHSVVVAIPGTAALARPSCSLPRPDALPAPARPGIPVNRALSYAVQLWQGTGEEDREKSSMEDLHLTSIELALQIPWR
jgi:hypothetical protein